MRLSFRLVLSVLGVHPIEFECIDLSNVGATSKSKDPFRPLDAQLPCALAHRVRVWLQLQRSYRL
jgi:hypothetical protein